MGGTNELRFYGELARWWPLISPPEDYVDEAADIATLLDRAEGGCRTVLELGSGGGHNAVHLAHRFELTLVDLSEDMLAVSRRLNPDLDHVLGDMRDVRLGRVFDAVLVHDAIDYMLTETDLAAAMATARAHLRPGGVAVFLPDHTAEWFLESSDHDGTDGDDGRAVRYLEWSWDPDPTDTTVLTEYAFVLREADGTVRTVHETHETGLFPEATWMRLLAAAGFDAEAVPEDTDEDRPPRTAFLGTLVRSHGA